MLARICTDNRGNVFFNQQAFTKKSAYQTLIFLFINQTYVVGTQKNSLNETVLLSTKTCARTDGYENINNFTQNFVVYLNL